MCVCVLRVCVCVCLCVLCALCVLAVCVCISARVCEQLRALRVAVGMNARSAHWSKLSVYRCVLCVCVLVCVLVRVPGCVRVRVYARNSQCMSAVALCLCVPTQQNPGQASVAATERPTVGPKVCLVCLVCVLCAVCA